MIHTLTICFSILSTDLAAQVEFRITTPSHPGTPPSLSYPGDPPEGCEFEVDSITLHHDLPGKLSDPIDLPPWLYTAIEESQKLADAISDYEANLNSSDSYDD